MAGDRCANNFSDMKTPKPPVIRRGQKHPYVKGTREQIDQRRGFVARLLASGARKMEIHRAVREKFGILWRQTDRYLEFVNGSAAVPDTRLAGARAGTTLNSSLDESMRQLQIIIDAAKKSDPSLFLNQPNMAKF